MNVYDRQEERRLIVAMLAEGHPIWYVAAMVKRHSDDIETIAVEHGYPDVRRLRRAAHRLSAVDNPWTSRRSA